MNENAELLNKVLFSLAIIYSPYTNTIKMTKDMTLRMSSPISWNSDTKIHRLTIKYEILIEDMNI